MLDQLRVCGSVVVASLKMVTDALGEGVKGVALEDAHREAKMHLELALQHCREAWRKMRDAQAVGTKPAPAPKKEK